MDHWKTDTIILELVRYTLVEFLVILGTFFLSVWYWVLNSEPYAC
jgi:cbb3-type cytochrome oxidase subunit 3